MVKEDIKKNPLIILDRIIESMVHDIEICGDELTLIKDNRSLLLKSKGSDIKDRLDVMFNLNLHVECIKKLFDCGIIATLFKKKGNFDEDMELLSQDIKSIDDFYSIICHNDFSVYKKNLNGDSEIAKGIKAIGSVFVGVSEMGLNLTDESVYRLIGYGAMNVSNRIINSGVIPGFMQKAISSLDNTTYPKCAKDFPVKARDIRSIKYIKESELKDVIQTMVISVMSGKFPLDKEVLLEVYRRGLLKI